MDWLEQLGWDLKGLGELLSRRDDAVAAPMTFGMIIFIGTVSLTHFVWRHRRKGFRAYAGPSAVRRASATSIWSVSPGTLLTFRATVFTVSFWLRREIYKIRAERQDVIDRGYRQFREWVTVETLPQKRLWRLGELFAKYIRKRLS